MKNIRKKILNVVEFVEPSSTLVKLKSSELRYISKILIESKLVIRFENERNVYIPANYYKLILNAVKNDSEFKELVKNDLQNKIRNEIVSWKKGKRIKHDIRLHDTKLFKYSKIISKQKGTLKKKYVQTDNGLKESMMIDKRLSEHLEKQLKL